MGLLAAIRRWPFHTRCEIYATPTCSGYGYKSSDSQCATAQHAMLRGPFSEQPSIMAQRESQTDNKVSGWRMLNGPTPMRLIMVHPERPAAAPETHPSICFIPVLTEEERRTPCRFFPSTFTVRRLCFSFYCSICFSKTLTNSVCLDMQYHPTPTGANLFFCISEIEVAHLRGRTRGSVFLRKCKLSTPASTHCYRWHCPLHSVPYNIMGGLLQLWQGREVGIDSECFVY